MSYDHTSPVKNKTLCTQNGVSDNSTTATYGNVAATAPSADNVMYSSTNTPSPKNIVISSSARVAVVSPLFRNNTPYVSPFSSRNTYPIKGTSTPFRPTERENTSLDSSFSSERSHNKGKYSPYKLDNTTFSQSNSSISSNGTPNDSYNERYSLVGYNTSPTTTPVGRNNKAGWYDMHDKHVELASKIHPTILLCGDSIVAGLQRYANVWNKYFKSWGALNCGIGGDQTQHVLWRMENMTFPSTVKYAVVHCGTNNIDRDPPQQIANGVISCGLVLQDTNRQLKVIVTGLIPRDYEVSDRRYKIKETNKCLKRYCQQFANFVYMKQDNDWVFGNGILNEKYYYTDYLHLIESGNDKFATSIIRTINRLENNQDVSYSSDEGENEHKFERKYGVRRNDTPKRDNFLYESPFKLVRQSNERKRSLSPDNDTERLTSSQKRVRVQNPLMDNEGYDRYATTQKPVIRSLLNTQHTTDTSAPISNLGVSVNVSKPEGHGDFSKTESHGDVSKPEYHGDFAITKELKYEKLDGTVKSIDITLTDKDRLAARKAKFGVSPVGVGSSLKRLSDSAKADVRGTPVTTKVPAKRRLVDDTEGGSI